MAGRIDFNKAAPEGMHFMRALEHTLNSASGLERVLLEMVRLRASLMNGCHFCIEMHTAELKKLNEPEGRIADVAEWRGSDAYTQRERAALGWAEAITNIQDGHAPDAVYEPMREHFTDAEITNLTLAITTINAWNRIAIGLGEFPGHAEAVDGGQ